MKSILKSNKGTKEIKKGDLLISDKTYIKSQSHIILVTNSSPESSRFAGILIWVDSLSGDLKLGQSSHGRIKNYQRFEGTIELSQ